MDTGQGLFQKGSLFRGNTATKLDSEMASTKKPRPKNSAMVAMGRRLAGLRLAAGMSQEQLARAVDITSGYVSRIEQGVRGCSDDVLDRMAKALRTTAAQIRYGATGVAEGRPGYAPTPPTLKEFLATPEGALATPEDVARMLVLGEQFAFEPTVVTWRLLFAALKSGAKRAAPTPNTVRYKQP